MINPYPGLPKIEYIKPISLSDASQFLADHEGSAKVFLGGTDILVKLRNGVLKLDYLVDIKGLEGTTDLSFDPEKGLVIGAAVTMNQVAKHPDIIKYYPNLVQAVNAVASYQLRNRATIIGNICNASPAGDTIGTCMILDGAVNIKGTKNEHAMPLTEFFLGPGRTDLMEDEIVTSITIPPPPTGMVGIYKKLGRNKISDLSIVGVAALGFPNAKSPSGYSFKIALASVAPVPMKALEAEAILAKKAISGATIDEAADAAMNATTPIDDVRSSARYRKLMVRNLVREALTELVIKLKQK